MTSPHLCVESTSRTTSTQMTSSPTLHAQPTALRPSSRYAMSRLHCMHLAACLLAFYAETAFRLVASIGFCLPFYMLLPFANIFLFGYNCRLGLECHSTSMYCSLQAVTLIWFQLCQHNALIPASLVNTAFTTPSASLYRLLPAMVQPALTAFPQCAEVSPQQASFSSHLIYVCVCYCMLA